MKKIILFLLLVSLLLFLLSSCRKTESAEDILLSITKELDSLPYGNLYLKSAEEGDAAFLNEEIIKALYGDGAVEYEFSLIEDFAVYLCPKEPCEVAVFKCYSSSDTDVIATMCLRRTDALCILLEGTPYNNIPKNAKVDISGHFVTVVMARD